MDQRQKSTVFSFAGAEIQLNMLVTKGARGQDLNLTGLESRDLAIKYCKFTQIMLSYIQRIATRKVDSMSVSYNRLWKLLIDRKISQSDFRKAANIAPNTMTKLRRGQYVALPILDRICDTLGVDFSDIITHESAKGE